MSYASSKFAQRPNGGQKDSAVASKYRPQVKQLQELFPAWSNDGEDFSFYYCRSTSFICILDLQSLLVETHGDVDAAAVRITEGDPSTELERLNV
jgi:hypothetical protein